MNSTENNLSKPAEQGASSKANAASAAENVDMTVEDDNYHYDPNAPLRDYNEDDDDAVPVYAKANNDQDVAAAQIKEAKKAALREKLALNGYALRTVLMNEQVKAHYVSPMAIEDEMPVEDILSEIPEEDLHEVGIV
jgi:hypothetical protein